MKTLFVSLVAFLFAFIIGCQESSITDPVSNDTGFNPAVDQDAGLNPSVEKNITLDKDIISSLYPGVIQLSGILKDPTIMFNGYVGIKGVVRYRVSQIYYDKPAPHTSTMKVQLYVNAELKRELEKTNLVWRVIDKAETIFNTTSANQLLFIEKSFRVQNSKVPLNLVLKFQVDEKTVSLVSKELRLANSAVIIPDPVF